MKKLKTAAVTAVMIGLCSLLGGCTAVQVNERMYVQMMGLSEEDGECVLCVQVCSTESAPDEPPVYEFYEGRGEGLKEAMIQVAMKMKEAGRAFEEIAAITDLPISEIQKL